MRRFPTAVLLFALSAAPAVGQSTTPPALSSRPGAAYTLYLNFGGFTFTGNWGGTLNSPPAAPGVTPAYDTDGNPALFSAVEQANIQRIWSRMSEAYAPFNINVTTVDPATQTPPRTDPQKQAFYDAAARSMHTVVGGNGDWFNNSIGATSVVGVSFVGVAQDSFPTNLNGVNQNGGAGAGLHTNWGFAARSGLNGNATAVGVTITHENGHALNLDHLNLSPGTGTGSRGAIMNASVIGSERALWAVGPILNGGGAVQNDVQKIQLNAGIRAAGATGFVDSGNGHTTATAAALPVSGSTIDATLARGLITPVNSDAPNPQGEANYTTDLFRLVVNQDGGSVSAVLRSGRSTLTAGTADPGATLDATFRLLDAGGAVLQTSNNSGLTNETITASNLTAGTYFLQVSSAGASATYYDMGSYFITGTFVAVPEPGLMLFVVAGVWAVRRRVRAAA